MRNTEKEKKNQTITSVNIDNDYIVDHHTLHTLMSFLNHTVLYGSLHLRKDTRGESHRQNGD